MRTLSIGWRRSLFCLSCVALLACPGDPKNPDIDTGEEPSPELLETQTAIVDQSGGSLTFEDGSTLAIPTAALATPTEITATRWQLPTEDREEIEYRFEPSGIVFARPAKLSLRLPDGFVANESVVGFSPAMEDALVSIGGEEGTAQMASHVVSTGRAAVIRDPGVRSVFGVALTTHFLHDGTVTFTPAQLDEALTVWAPAGAAEQTALSTTITPEGTFRFDGVPNGAYALEYNSGTATKPSFTRLVTDRAIVDLGSSTQRRPDAVSLPDEATLTITLQSPSSPQPEDIIEVISSGAGLWQWASWDDPNGDDYPLRRRFDNATDPGLVDSSKGDSLLISRNTKQTNDTGFDYSASVDRVVLDSIIQSPTSATEVLSTLSPYAGTETTAFDLELGAFFEAPQMGACPDRLFSGGLYQALTPHSQDELQMIERQLVSFDVLDASLDAESLVTGPLTYGVDPSQLGEKSLTTSALSYESVHVEGQAGTLLRRCGELVSNRPAPAAWPAPIRPRLGPAPHLRVNGVEASAPLSGMTTGPLEIEWDAPTLGEVARYRVILQRVGGDTLARNLLMFWTKDTQVHVPGGLLQPGDVFRVLLTGEQFEDWEVPSPQRGPATIDRFKFDSALITTAP